MNGVHDVGGMQDMGPIHIETNEPVFHARWEGRVYALNRALGAWRKWNLDNSRWTQEMLSPAEYFTMSYYERWYHRMLKQLVESKLLTRAEIETGKPAKGSSKLTPALRAEEVTATFTKARFEGRSRAGAPPRSQPASVSARATSILPATRACPAMREGTSAPSRQIRAFLPCPTPTQRFKEKIHSTSIRFDSRLANCGENKPDRRTWSTSTCGTHISIPPDGSCSGGPSQDSSE